MIDRRLLSCTRSQLLVLRVIEVELVDGKFEVSFSELARMCEMGLRSVKEAVAGLKGKGLLRVCDRGGADGSRNVYEVMGDVGQQCSSETKR